MFAVIKPSADRTVQRASSWSETAIRNALSPLERIGDEMIAFTAARFNTGTSPEGVAWASLKASTVRYKRGGATLVESGRLRSSFIKNTERQSNKVTVRSAVDYGFFLQRGTRRMSARPITPESMPATLRERIRVITREEILRAVDQRAGDIAATRGSR
jgi:phage gpG-like protein